MSRYVPLKAVLLASAMVLPTLAAAAEKAMPLSLADLAPAAAAKVELKRLPAGRDEMTFFGESGSRSWRVSLTPAEAARVSAFQVATERSVVVLPEQSGVTVSVNGQTLATVAPVSTEKPKVVTVKIPPGLLVAGENVVRFDVALAHRVDCSLEATYELWARLDPASTGFVGAASNESYRSLKDIASETVGEDGATHIRARLNADASPETVAQYARFLGGVARHAGLRRAVVETAPEPGRGAGFDLLIASDAEQLVADGGARLIGRDGDVLFLRNADTGRLTVALNAADGPALETSLTALGGHPPQPAQTERDFRFADLDLYSGPFAGRHYLSTTPIELPGDFFSANYDSVNVWLDAAHVAGLDDSAGVTFRVNGAIASSLPFAGDQAESFTHRLIPLPLSYFRPGHNELTVEAFVGSPADAQCEIGAGARAERLRIEPTSEIRLPRMVRLAETPRIASAVQAAREGEHGLDVYIPAPDAASLGLALTTLADLDLVDAARTPRVHFRAPASGDRPGLFVSLADAAPANLTLTTLKKDEPAPAAVTGYGAPGFLPEGFRQRLDRLAGTLRAAPAAGLRLPSKYIAVAAVAPQAQGALTGALRPPQFIDSSAQWLSVLASDPLAETEGAAHFAANGGFNRLTGQAFAYDVETGATNTVEPDKLEYVMPRHLDPLDVRPILGGLFAENMTLTLLAFALLIGALGLSTHTLVRRMGASEKTGASDK